MSLKKKILHIGRLALTCASTTAFFLFSGYIESFYTRNQNQIDLKLLYENNVNNVVVTKRFTEPLSKKEHQIIEKYVNKTNVVNTFRQMDDSFFDVLKNVSIPSDCFENFGLLELPQNESYLKFVSDKRLGNTISSLPKSENEIALTSYQADCYLKYGYRDNMHQTVILTSVRDLIGKKLDKFTITGIFESLSFKEEGISKDYIVKEYGKDVIHIDETLPDFNPLERYFIIGTNLYSSFNETNSIEEYMGTSDGIYMNLPEEEKDSLSLLKELNDGKETDTDVCFYTPYLNISRKGETQIGETDLITAITFPPALILNRSLPIALTIVFGVLCLIFYPLSIYKESQKQGQAKAWKRPLFVSLILTSGCFLLSSIGLWILLHVLNERLGCLFFMINPWFVLLYVGEAVLLSLIGIGMSLITGKVKKS